jgi:hypothetical protein
MSLSCCFKSKWLEHHVDHLQPHANSTQEQSSGGWSEHLIFILDNPILMMHTNCAKCYLLILPVDLIQKTLMGKQAVISMGMLYNAICLRQNLLKGLSCKNHLIDSKVLHEMNIDKSTNVITERRASPNLMIC